MAAWPCESVECWQPHGWVRRGRGVTMVETEPREHAGSADEWFRSVYDEHWARLVRLAAVLLGSTDRADEVVQEAMLGLLRNRAKLSKGPVTGYLRTAVVNGCRSVHRHRAVVAKHPEPAPAPVAGPEERVVATVTADAVMEALRTLPQRQQEVLVLRYYSGLSEAEIAEALGISRGAVKSYSHRGVSVLRQLMGRQS